MKQKHLASLLQENMTTVRVVFSNNAAPENFAPVPAPKHPEPYLDQYGDVALDMGSMQWQPKKPAKPAERDSLGKSYVYKALREDNFKAGDIAVVHSPRGFVLVMVVQVDEHPQIDVDADYEYKWIVQKVDLGRYNRQLEAEKNFQAALLEIERRKHTNRIRNELLEMYGDTEEGKLLLEASIRQLGGGAV